MSHPQVWKCSKKKKGGVWAGPKPVGGCGYEPSQRISIAGQHLSCNKTIVCSTGLDYIRAALSNRPVNPVNPVTPVTPVVILLPFIGGFSRSLNTASRDMVARGAVVIAAAGNQRDDACFYSPASEPEVARLLRGLRSNGTTFAGIY